MDQAAAEKRKALLAQLQHVVRAGDVIFREGEETSELYILLAGSIEIKRGQKTIATVQEKDTYLGEMSTLLGLPRTATAVAKDDCVLIRIPEDKVTDFFTHSPTRAIKLARILAMRLHEMNQKHRNLMDNSAVVDTDTPKLYQRLICTPARQKMMEIYKSNVGKTLPVAGTVKALGLCPTEFNRIVMDYETAGLIKTDGDNVKLCECENKHMQSLISAFNTTGNVK